MVAIPLGVNDLESASLDVIRIKTRNMYLIQNPSSIDGFSRVSRPSLRTVNTVGDSGITGIWRRDGCLDGVTLVVSGDKLYRLLTPTDTNPTYVGDLPGEGYVQFSGSTDRALVLKAGLGYFTDGFSLTPIAMPDGRLINSVTYIDGLFIVTVKGEELWYWIQPEETSPDPLNFASAERFPDNLQAVGVVLDEIWFLGDDNEEVWQYTGDENIPLSRISGRAYNHGCLSPDTVVTTIAGGLPSLIWVTKTRTVVMSQGQPSKISNESVDELLKTATNLRAWTFFYNRHSFYVLTADQFSFLYDIEMQTWSRWDSYGKQFWNAHLGIQTGGVVYGADYDTGKIYLLEEGAHDDGNPIVREIQGTINHTAKPYKCASVSVKVNTGWSPRYGFEPILELRWSDDQRGTWSPYMQCSLGDKGQYSRDVFFRSLGLIQRPGRDFEFRFSDIATFRIDYATMNEV